MSATLVGDNIKVGKVNLGGQEFDVLVSANTREGVTPRPFILQDDKKRFLDKGAKDTFNSEFKNTDKVLYLENLSRVAETQVTETSEESIEVKIVDDKVIVDAPESATKEDIAKAVAEAGVEVDGEKIDEALITDQDSLPKVEDPKVHVVTDHSSTPFDLSKVYSQAVSESTRSLPEEYILIREYDHAEREYGGDVQAYLDAGNKKTDRLKWETVHINTAEGTQAQIGEQKKLWYKFNAAAREGRKLLPHLPIYRYRDGKVVRVKSIK
ncbi:hypothetical protein SP15_281 [Bacillus phage SP-15]|uniref:Uncharacterized protein n=1 Tax=Bacillus phage SP-15 TaxID=1792032 RepID=A0A127AWL1_9CAUD|nr:hypothetical protein SP15_281 [Bacillus phage SP-15]AMM45089.1 hypothetical protein SP15_281 [Bacillus phage SP-15]